MDISTGLIAKAAAGTAAIAATTTTGVIYGEDIVGFFSKSEEVAVLNNSSNVELNKKLISLGLPDGCKFDETNGEESEKDCGALNDDKLKAIKFDGRGTEDLTITGAASNLSLKIRKDGERDIFTEGIKIIFEVRENVTISNGGLSSQILFRKGTNPEFKIKTPGETTIEKAWTSENLAKKVGLTCPASKSNECNDFSGTINVLEKNNKKLIGATATKGSAKVKFEKDQRGYNQGFRFLIESGDINLSLDPNTSGINSLPVGATYEIKQEAEGWFLKRVWDMGGFVAAVGLKDCAKGNTGNSKTCTLKKDEILNIYDGTNKVTDAKVGDSIGKIKVTEDEKYNLGFKLTVEEKISLNGGNVSSGSTISALEKNNTEYEMKFESNKWFLTKKSAN